MRLIAQNTITNPVLPDTLGTGADLGSGGGGLILAKLIATVWQALIVVGGLATLLWMIYGAFTWIVAGGDKERLDNARQRITNAIIGMAILFATIAFVNFLGPAIGFDLLKINLPSFTTSPITNQPNQSTTHIPGGGR